MIEKIKALFIKYRELISYLFFGGCTTLVNWLSYSLFVRGLGFSVTGGNVGSWVCAVLFAFVTNKLWVFESRSWGRGVWREAGGFFASRAATGVFEVVAVPAAMHLGLNQSLFGVEGFAAKIVVSVVVVILNYILSKFIVFKKESR